MPSLDKVLLPVDFSERSLAAAHCVQRLARYCSPQIILLHVLGPVQYPGDTEMSGVMLGELYRNQVESLTRELERFQCAEFAGAIIRRVVLEGDPASRIVEFAHQEQVDLIMMPTHGCGLFRRYLLGSNTAKVLHDAECPVWTGVHMAEAATRPVEIASVLCAVDMGPQSEHALEWAAWLSRAVQVPLTLLHVSAAVPDTSNGGEDALRARLRWSAEQAFERLQARTGSQAEAIIEAGDPAKTICAVAARIRAGVLVIGRGSAAGGFGRLRANAYAIIRKSPCPVVSV